MKNTTMYDAERAVYAAEGAMADAKAAGDYRCVEEAECDLEDARAEVRRHERRIDALMERGGP